jgi:hypothetical protein
MWSAGSAEAMPDKSMKGIVVKSAMATVPSSFGRAFGGDDMYVHIGVSITLRCKIDVFRLGILDERDVGMLLFYTL